MLILLVALVVLAAWKMKFHRFHTEYIGRRQTGAMKGICAMLILFSHLFQYITPVTRMDSLLHTILGLLGQLTVTLFFFYSGYGIHQSIVCSENGRYLDSFAKKRILKTLFCFDVAVLLYAVLNLTQGIKYPAINYVLCWIGWEGIGNSSWFVFAILCMYLLTLVSFRMCKNQKGVVPVALVTGLTLVYCVAIRYARSDTWWYDTVLCYPLGMSLSLYKDRFKELCRKKYWIVLAVLVAAFAVLYYLKNQLSYWLFLPMAGVFCLLVITVNMKIEVYNGALEWLGSRAFSIFILQRIPMILLSRSDLIKNNLLFSLISVGATLILAQLFDMVVNLLSGRLFSGKAIQNQRSI